MLTQDVIKHFSSSPDDPRGAKAAITEALQLSSGYVSQWGDVVPQAQAMKLHFLTKGKLKYDPASYQKARSCT